MCLKQQKHSSEEAHIGSEHTIVEVTDTREHPLGPGLTTKICTEEVEEDGGVERADCLLNEIIVVCINLALSLVMWSYLQFSASMRSKMEKTYGEKGWCLLGS